MMTYDDMMQITGGMILSEQEEDWFADVEDDIDALIDTVADHNNRINNLADAESALYQMIRNLERQVSAIAGTNIELEQSLKAARDHISFLEGI